MSMSHNGSRSPTNLLRSPPHAHTFPNNRINLASVPTSPGRPSITLATPHYPEGGDDSTASQMLLLEAHRRKQLLAEKWRLRIRGCASSGKAAIPVWKFLLNGALAFCVGVCVGVLCGRLGGCSVFDVYPLALQTSFHELILITKHHLSSPCIPIWISHAYIPYTHTHAHLYTHTYTYLHPHPPGRRMVLNEREDFSMMLEFASLCRHGGNHALAERVLSNSGRALGGGGVPTQEEVCKEGRGCVFGECVCVCVSMIFLQLSLTFIYTLL